MSKINAILTLPHQIDFETDNLLSFIEVKDKKINKLTTADKVYKSYKVNKTPNKENKNFIDYNFEITLKDTLKPIKETKELSEDTEEI